MSKQLITISKTALHKFRNILIDNKSKVIYLKLNGGGCNGFEYSLKPTNDELKDGDEIIIYRKDNTSTDKPPTVHDVVFHVCGKSMLYLLGTHIDWHKDIMGSSFKFENPNAVSKCGCGTSFTPFDF